MPCDANDVKKVISIDPTEAIDIKGGTKINVSLEKTLTKDIYTISYKEYAPPTITVAHTGPGPLVVKVGTVVNNATFAGLINSGSENIVERTMIPDKGLDLTLPVSYTETGIIGTSPGLWPQFSGVPTVITVKDALGTIVSKQVGVEFRHLFYVGFSTKDTLNEAEIKAIVKADAGIDLLTSVFSKYSSYSYRNDNIVGLAIPVYLYWIIPTYSPQINSATEGPIPIPLTTLGAITITEIVGYAEAYTIYRTSTKSLFTGATPIKLL